MHKLSAAVAITILSGITAVGLAADGGGKKGPPPGPRDGQNGPQGQGQGDGDRHRPSPEEVFKHMDKNGDGKVSLEEFLAAPPPPPPPGKDGKGRGPGGDGQKKGGDQGAKKAGGDQPGAKKGGGDQGGPRPEGKGHPSREEIFKHLDKDGDGFLSLEEFKAGRPPRPEGEGKGGKRPPQGDGQKKS